MSRIVFGGTKHPAHVREETIRRLNDLLPDLVDLLNEAELWDLELRLKSDGRAELSLSGKSISFRDTADVHPEAKRGFDATRLLG